MKKLLATIVLGLVSAINVFAVGWSSAPPSSVMAGQSYGVGAYHSTGSTTVIVYILKNGTIVSSASGSYGAGTSYTSTDSGPQTITYRAEGWNYNPGNGLSSYITAYTTVTAPNPTVTGITTDIGTVIRPGNVFKPRVSATANINLGSIHIYNGPPDTDYNSFTNAQAFVGVSGTSATVDGNAVTAGSPGTTYSFYARCETSSPTTYSSSYGPITFTVSNSAPDGYLDSVSYSNGTITGNGWAADPETGAPVTRVEIYLDGASKGNASLGGDRVDVSNGYGRSDYRYSGYNFSFASGGISPGGHTVMARAFDSWGAYSERTNTVTVTNAAPTITGITTVPSPLYAGSSFPMQATAADSDANLTSICLQMRINGGAWTTFSQDPIGGSSGTSLYKTITAGPPGTTYQFQAQASDTSTSSAWQTTGVYTVANRSPYGPSISASGSGVAYNATYGHYQMWAETPLTISAQVSDYDGDLVNHSIWRIISPLGNDWLLINDGTAGNPNAVPSNASQSTKTVTYTPVTPGRYDFHTNGQDSIGTWSGGASITVWVYGPNNNAMALSQTINGVANPSSISVSPGQVFSAAISMRNNGDKPWNSDATPHRLGTGGSWGLTRVGLPVSVVNPWPEGDSDVTFSFSATAPSSPGAYAFQWQMLEEGIQWFGAATSAVTVNVNAAPAVTSHPQSLTLNAGSPATFSVTAVAWPSPTYQWLKNGANIPGATASSYSIASVQAQDAAGYSVVLTNSQGSTTSNVASLTVNTLPAFTTQPQNQAVNQGTTATFSAAANGIPSPTFQWRKGGVNIAGATSTTLILANVQPIDEAAYSVVATNSVGSTTSYDATLTVYRLPVILGQPQNQGAAVGATAVFTVNASGVPAPSFQWRKNGATIPGATLSTLTLSSVQASDVATYSVIVTNIVGSVTSNDASLTVTQPDTSNQNLLNIHIPAGS